MKITRRDANGKEPQPLVKLRRLDEGEEQEARDQVLSEQLHQAQEQAAQRAAWAAEITTMQARRLELRRDLEAARPALTNANLRLAEARAKGEGDLDALRAEVANCKREIEELEAAIDIVDAGLARLDRGVQHGKFKVV